MPAINPRVLIIGGGFAGLAPTDAPAAASSESGLP